MSDTPQHNQDERPLQRWKVGYKWRQGYRDDDGFYSAGTWKRGTLIVEVPTPLQLITRAERIARDMHPGCETRVTHLLGIVKDAPDSEVCHE